MSTKPMRALGIKCKQGECSSLQLLFTCCSVSLSCCQASHTSKACLSGWRQAFSWLINQITTGLTN